MVGGRVSRSRRILHVIGGMNRGGVETWLMHVLRAIDSERYRMDFLVHAASPCAYDEEIRALGSRIIPCPSPSRPWTYARNLYRILKELGPFDVVHSHVHHYSGAVLKVADWAGVPARIAHSHNDTRVAESGSRPLRRLYLRLTRHWIERHATLGLACSRVAAESLYGNSWEDEQRRQILHYGIDLASFAQPVDRAAVRAELGIPGDAVVLGHVGRFDEQKNHAFLLETAAEIVRRDPRFRLLLVGDGPLRPAIERKVRELAISGAVVLTGVRSDIPRLMLAAMDVFVFPSFFEGLPVAFIEAQAAGLPCVISDVVSEETDIIKPLIRRVGLSQPADVWADAVGQSIGSAMPPKAALGILESSPFAITTSVAELERIYCD